MSLKNKFNHRLMYALLFGALFVFVGWVLPEMYFKYFDKTEYYKVTQPVSVDKKIYHPCDDITFDIKREALLDIVASIRFEAVRLIPGDGVQKYPMTQATQASFTKGKGQILVTHKLPCEVPDGTYNILASVKYVVRNFEKNYVWSSELFKVEATPSARLDKE